MSLPAPRIHPTALIEDGVILGPGCSIWDGVHIRRGAKLGEECIVGEKSYIAYDVAIGNRVKINAHVYICAGVTIEDGVMLSAGVIFTNDRFPRATTPDLLSLRPSEPDEETGRTVIREGATIGAGAIIGLNIAVGRWAMAGMGSIVTHDVPDFHLVLGAPARSIGCVCRCGKLVARWQRPEEAMFKAASCPACGRLYGAEAGAVREIPSPASE